MPASQAGDTGSFTRHLLQMLAWSNGMTAVRQTACTGPTPVASSNTVAWSNGYDARLSRERFRIVPGCHRQYGSLTHAVVWVTENHQKLIQTQRGPPIQWGFSSVGERLHGMEDVEGSNPSSSTNVETWPNGKAIGWKPIERSTSRAGPTPVVSAIIGLWPSLDYGACFGSKTSQVRILSARPICLLSSAAEQRSLKPWVRGPNPRGGTNYYQILDVDQWTRSALP
jgi:hypothetical protein